MSNDPAAFVQMIARMTPTDDAEDAIETVNQLIELARAMTACTPCEADAR